jgi:hypothetical protein
VEPNIVEGASGEGQLQVFRHSFQNQTRQCFFWVTAQVGVVPSLPLQPNATVWEQDCVLTRLLGGCREQPLEINTSIEPEPKRQKGLLPVDTASSVGTVAIDSTSSAALCPNTIEFVLSTDVTANWWDSAMLDVFLHHAPSSIGLIAMERNCHGAHQDIVCELCSK